MSAFVIIFPAIDPVLLRWGPVAVNVYSLAYFAALASIWVIARYLVTSDDLWNETPRPSLISIDYLIVYILFGSIIGGRLGHVLQLPAVFWSHPQDIFAFWDGGNSLHGAGIGGCFATLFFARRNGYSALTSADICAPGVALGIFFGRIANFIRGELWGRPTEVPWAMVFPGAGPVPRHPSQLYEATLEGLVVFVILSLAIRSGVLKRRGFSAGIFGVSHGTARIFCENFREPDAEGFHLPYGLTVGMVLSSVAVVAGVFVIRYALRQPTAPYNGAGP